MEVAMRNDVTLREEYLLKIWDNYIHDNLVESTPCKAAIYDYRSKRLIVASSGFYLFDKELDAVVEGIKYPDLIHADGITIQNHHYDVRLADGRHGIYAKNKEDGCTVCKTYTLLIVGVHDKRVKSEVCNEEIMKLGDYFMKLGL